MAIGNGDPGGASTEGSRPERAGQDAVELLHQEDPHSIANQLKEAATGAATERMEAAQGGDGRVTGAWR